MYKWLKENESVLKDGATSIVKDGHGWNDFLRWQAAGGVPDEADPEPVPPTDAEKLETEATTAPFSKALVRALASLRQKTEQETLDWLKSMV